MGKSWKSFEVHARKSLQTIKGDSGESSERKRESYTEILNLFREYLSHHERTVDRSRSVRYCWRRCRRKTLEIRGQGILVM